MSLRPLLDLLVQQPRGTGVELARALGISRAAVWKQMDRLRALGLDFAARAGSGYQLAHPLQLLDSDALLAQMSADTRSRISVLSIVEETPSTSADLLQQASKASSGKVRLSEAQTAGRGQRGRRWQSPFASGFLGSILWRFDRGLSGLGGLSLAMGVAVADALQSLDFSVRIKWPNDLVTESGKLGGILIDAGGEAHGDCFAVIGLGLNGRLSEVAQAMIDQPATSLARLGPMLDRNLLAARILQHQIVALEQFAQNGFAPFRERFQRRDALLGREVVVDQGIRQFQGIADGLDESARLCVKINGDRRPFDVGEVRVRGVAS